MISFNRIGGANNYTDGAVLIILAISIKIFFVYVMTLFLPPTHNIFDSEVQWIKYYRERVYTCLPENKFYLVFLAIMDILMISGSFLCNDAAIIWYVAVLVFVDFGWFFLDCTKPVIFLPKIRQFIIERHLYKERFIMSMILESRQLFVAFQSMPSF